MKPRTTASPRRPFSAARSETSLSGGIDERHLMGLLGLPARAHDPVTIITAAHVRLRRWRRRLEPGPGHVPVAGDRIRLIAAARDTLLRRACRAAEVEAGT